MSDVSIEPTPDMAGSPRRFHWICGFVLTNID